ncbi:MAG: UvrD-helicase domain-containing protein [Nocardioidaceae bacterium]
MGETMGAGASAHYEAERALLEADEYSRLRREAENRARRYELASRTEAEVGGRLAALESLGWRVLADRRWAGSKRANVDFLLVGPGGVVVVDVKAWRALEVRNGSVFCDDECRDDELSKLLSLTERVQDSVSLLGLTPQSLTSVLVFAGRRFDGRAGRVALVGERNAAAWVTRLGCRLSAEQIEDVRMVLEQDFPPYDRPEPKPVRVPKVRIVMPPPLTPAPATETLFDVTELTDALLQNALAGPIEEWMTYLHPDQLKLVSTSWNGPARVRGAAGTGKTVVGLHRAAYLAERTPKKVLFVSFVKTLPVVLASLCERMSPSACANIDFLGVHKLAIDILDEAGIDSSISQTRVRNAFNAAWAAVGRDSVLPKLDERPAYWKEEIDYVIKGRGLTDFDEYADLGRVGRRTPMRIEHRKAMWNVYREYERRLDQLGVHDFTDVLIMARDAVRSGDVELPYGTVVVDEVQDLNLVGLQLLHAIAGDGPDSLLIVGDGQQAVYPGGFTLAEAGIAVTGRAAVLRANYRNAVEILEVAARVVAWDEFDDLEGPPSAGARDVDVRRSGGTTITVRAADQRSLDAALVKQIQETITVLGVAPGDMAVLVRTRRDLERYERVLSRAGIDNVDLRGYDGKTTDRVKVGTFKRAKGLEFKFVFLPGLADAASQPWSGESADSLRERLERERRELYVGMTRARDGLWLGYLRR